MMAPELQVACVNQHNRSVTLCRHLEAVVVVAAVVIQTSVVIAAVGVAAVVVVVVVALALARALFEGYRLISLNLQTQHKQTQQLKSRTLNQKTPLCPTLQLFKTLQSDVVVELNVAVVELTVVVVVLDWVVVVELVMLVVVVDVHASHRVGHRSRIVSRRLTKLCVQRDF